MFLNWSSNMLTIKFKIMSISSQKASLYNLQRGFFNLQPLFKRTFSFLKKKEELDQETAANFQQNSPN